MIKAILFDLDGTLADTIEDLRESMNRMLTQNGYPAQDRAGILRAINYGARKFVMRSLPNDGEDLDEARIDELFACYQSIYSRNYMNRTVRYDGLLEAVRELKAMGYRLAVLSNKQDEFVKKITEALYPGEFELVMGQSAFPTKPAPDAPLYIAGQLGCEPCEMAMVGDSHVDIKTGINAGMLPTAVTWGFCETQALAEAGARVLIHTPEQLVEFFRMFR